MIGLMEGPLSKWTNVVQGWQYRWFVLGEDALLYYTSKEKMLKCQQRGCIRLRGAVVGIEGESNPCLFTITVDGKIFHLQGRDESERTAWVKALEASIRALSAFQTPSMAPKALKAQLAHADVHMKAISDGVYKLEAMLGKKQPLGAEGMARPENLGDAEKAAVEELMHTASKFFDYVGRGVVLLQMAQSRLECTILMKSSSSNNSSRDVTPLQETPRVDVKAVLEHGITPISYSSSDDEFYDAEDEGTKVATVAGSGGGSSRQVAGAEDNEEEEDYDAAYDNAEESELGDVSQQGSVISHLLSQVSIGMDLTRVTLPTFILERRSLLEMYADFFTHPDAFVLSADLEDPEERFINVIRYYLCSFYAARKSGVAKKPYNPVLGEVFRCRYDVPGLRSEGSMTESGPFLGADTSSLTFIAEQVSHHPPISAFYAEHPTKRISFTADIYTKSSFLGLSIGVSNIGMGRVILHDLDEEYTMTFPSGYGRSILSTPWIELGGKVKVTCEKTGYRADIEFLTKPFLGGRPHRVTGNLYRAGDRKPMMTVRGEWNNVLYAKRPDQPEYILCDLRAERDCKKICQPVMEQKDYESRKLWRRVTMGLLRNEIPKATTAKREIEQRQRDEAKERSESGETWTPRHFEFDQESKRWVFKEALLREPL